MSTASSGYHQLTPDLQQSVDEHHARFCDHLQTMREALADPKLDLKPAYKLDHLLKTQPDLVPEFEQDPRGFAKQRVGLELPDHFHIHYIDPNGKYWPQTANAASETAPPGADAHPWARAEIRMTIRNATGVGTIVIGSGDEPVEGIPYLPPGTGSSTSS
ncbi:MAG TPA: hypothetical protein VKU00_30750 [Chthonomonadaceae bacterium]|nr:hypothetical protein [Chthonomonadaceae bacterium]